MPVSMTTNCGSIRCTCRRGSTPSGSEVTIPTAGESSWPADTSSEPYTMVPLKLYFTGGKAKVELALAKGRKSQDRRQAIAKRDAERDIARAVRHTEKYDI
jgi:hypothetical protein